MLPFDSPSTVSSNDTDGQRDERASTRLAATSCGRSTGQPATNETEAATGRSGGFLSASAISRTSDHRSPTRKRFYGREANARGREQRRHFYRIRREQLFPRGGADRALTFRRQSAAAESRTVGTRLQENRAKRRDDFTGCPGKPCSYNGGFAGVKDGRRFFRKNVGCRRFSSVGINTLFLSKYVNINILQTGYRYRQSYRRKRASRLIVSILEIRSERYATGPTGRSLKLVSSKNIREQLAERNKLFRARVLQNYFHFASQHQKLSAKTVEYRVVIAQPHPRWDIGFEQPYRYRVLLARTIKSRRAGRGELPSTLVNLRLGIARSRICGCR